MADRGTAFLLRALEIERTIERRLRVYVRSAQDIKDFLQETYVRLLESSSAKQAEIQSIEAYVWTVARNVATDWHKNRHSSAAQFLMALDSITDFDGGQRPEELVHVNQVLDRMEQAIGQLPPRIKEVLRLRKLEGYTQKEIAQRLSIRPHTVESYLGEGLNRVAESLAEHLEPESFSFALRWLGRRRRRSR